MLQKTIITTVLENKRRCYQDNCEEILEDREPMRKELTVLSGQDIFILGSKNNFNNPVVMISEQS